jgi:tellurite resistance protein TerC
MSLRIRLAAYARRGFREARRLVILMVGSTVVLLGIVLIVTPGPAFIVIPAGLAILGLEFAFARRWLRQIRNLAGMEPNPSKKDTQEG